MAASDTHASGRTHMSVAEFAARRGLSEVTVRRYLRDGRLPFDQAVPGGRIMIPIDALITQSAGGPERAAPAPGATSPRTRRGPIAKWMRRRSPKSSI